MFCAGRGFVRNVKMTLENILIQMFMALEEDDLATYVKLREEALKIMNGRIEYIH